MAPYTNMPADVAALAAKTADDIRTGKLHPFTGPIYNQAGELVLGGRKTADDGMLAGMMYYIKGIDDKVPN